MAISFRVVGSVDVTQSHLLRALDRKNIEKGNGQTDELVRRQPLARRNRCSAAVKGGSYSHYLTAVDFK